MKNTIVSLFRNYKSTIPENTNLWDWLKNDSYSKDVEYIRQINDKKERNVLKSNLPCITPSGIFLKRTVSGLIKHSGFICIDIDSEDNPNISDFNQLRDQLKNIINVAYSGLSVSGKGVFCLIPILYPEKHKEHFEALKICFKNLGIIIDKSCGDISRLRGYSYDKDAYFNENAEMFNEIFEYKFDTSYLPKNEIIENSSQNDENTFKKVQRILNEIENTGIDITKNYNQWFNIGCALANEFGEEGREFFHVASRNHNKYHPESCDNLYSTCLERKYSEIGIGTFFHWAREYDLF